MENLEFYYEIVSNIRAIFTTAITAYCYSYFAGKFLKKKKYCWTVGAFYFAVMIFLYYMPWVINNFIAYIIGTGSGFFVMWILEKEKIEQKIFISIVFFSQRWMAMGMKNCLDRILYQYSYTIPGFSDNYKLQFYIFVVDSVITIVLTFLLMFFSVWVIQKAYVYKREGMTGKEMIMMFIPVLSAILGYGMLWYFYDFYEKSTGQSFYDLPFPYHLFEFFYYGISFMATLIMVVIFQDMKGRQRDKRRNEVLAGQAEEIKRHIAEVEKLYRDIRGIRHDMGNHIMVLENLCLKKEYKQAGEYAARLREQFSRTEGEIKSGNPVTDVILMERKREAEEKGIVFSCDFHYPEETGINTFDLSVVLNNALLNAVEAAQLCENPYIQVRSYCRGQAYMIEIKNSTANKAAIDEESKLPVTTKKDGTCHGFGLANIQTVAQKYYGDIDIQQNGESFQLDIMLMIG